MCAVFISRARRCAVYRKVYKVHERVCERKCVYVRTHLFLSFVDINNHFAGKQTHTHSITCVCVSNTIQTISGRYCTRNRSHTEHTCARSPFHAPPQSVHTLAQLTCATYALTVERTHLRSFPAQPRSSGTMCACRQH